MPIEIDYAGLRHAMTHHDPYEDPLYYLDTETGEVLAVTRETEKQVYELSDPDQAASPELHGRIGHFPAIVASAPWPAATPPAMRWPNGSDVSICESVSPKAIR